MISLLVFGLYILNFTKLMLNKFLKKILNSRNNGYIYGIVIYYNPFKNIYIALGFGLNYSTKKNWNENLENGPPHIYCHLPLENGYLSKC